MEQSPRSVEKRSFLFTAFDAEGKLRASDREMNKVPCRRSVRISFLIRICYRRGVSSLRFKSSVTKAVTRQSEFFFVRSKRISAFDAVARDKDDGRIYIIKPEYKVAVIRREQFFVFVRIFCRRERIIVARRSVGLIGPLDKRGIRLILH